MSEQSECPCCSRGKVVAGVCVRCGVGIARGALGLITHTVKHHTPRRRQDQDRPDAMTDYLRTKEDKS